MIATCMAALPCFSEISLKTCQQEGVDTRFNSLDTTAFALTGEYDPDCDEHTVLIILKPV